MKDRHWTFIYVMETKGGFRKIGLAEDPERRLKHIQTANPNQVTVAFTRRIPRGVAIWIETQAHSLLAAKHVHGEWFRASFADAVWAIKAAINAAHDEAFRRRGQERQVVVNIARTKRGIAGESPAGDELTG